MMEELEIYKSATGHKQTLLSSRWPAAGSLAAEAEQNESAVQLGAPRSHWPRVPGSSFSDRTCSSVACGARWPVGLGVGACPPAQHSPGSWCCAFPPGAIME